MASNLYRENEILRYVLDEFLEKAEEVERARSKLYSEEASKDEKAVAKAIMTIYGAIPSLRATVDTFQRVIDEIEDEEEAMKVRPRKRRSH